MDSPDLLDPLFREAVTAIDAGDVTTLERLLAEHPRLLRDRLDSPGAWLCDKVGGALEGVFRQPYLLWFVAEDPVRNGKLPPPRIRLFFSSLTGILLLIPALALYRELSQRSDIWWTPSSMLVPLTESRDRVEIYARGKPLGALLEAGQLHITDASGASALAVSEIGLRFNHWDRVRAQRLPLLLGYAAICGVGATFLLLFATGRLAHRGEKEPTRP